MFAGWNPEGRLCSAEASSESSFDGEATGPRLSKLIEFGHEPMRIRPNAST